MVGENPADERFSDPLTRAGLDAEAAATRPGHALHTALTHLLERAQRSGQIRPDVDTAVVMTVMATTVHAQRIAGPRSGARGRTLAVVLDGLRRISSP